MSLETFNYYRDPRVIAAMAAPTFSNVDERAMTGTVTLAADPKALLQLAHNPQTED